MHKTAIVTGASMGLGLELARALAERGWRLVVDARSAPQLETARAELAAITEVVAIVGDPDHRERLADAAGDGLALSSTTQARSAPRPGPRWPTIRSRRSSTSWR